MGSTVEHQNLIKKFKILALKEIPNSRFFERHVGLFYRRNGTPIKINKAGMADVYGVILKDNHAVHVELEFKTGNARLSTDQKQWQSFCEKFCIYHDVVRCEKESVKKIKNYIDII